MHVLLLFLLMLLLLLLLFLLVRLHLLLLIKIIVIHITHEPLPHPMLLLRLRRVHFMPSRPVPECSSSNHLRGLPCGKPISCSGRFNLSNYCVLHAVPHCTFASVFSHASDC
jgi:hypothetical protein